MNQIVIDKYQSATGDNVVRMGNVLMDLFGDVPIVGVEVGAFKGWNCKRMLDNHPKLTLTSIDMWDLHVAEGNWDYLNASAGEQPKQMQDVEWARSIQKECLERVAPYGDRCRIMKMSSMRASTAFADGSLDFAYVDGDHSYERCTQDLELWWPKVKVGGYMGGHDWGTGSCAGVTRAVKEFNKRENLPLIHTHTYYADWILGPKEKE